MRFRKDDMKWYARNWEKTFAWKPVHFRDENYHEYVVWLEFYERKSCMSIHGPIKNCYDCRFLQKKEWISF